MEGKNYSHISIIIPALNERKFIEEVLVALRNQEYPKSKYDITVVDNGSTDGTKELSVNIADNVISFDKKNVASMRNFGAKDAKGALLAFIDADCIADKNWLKNANKAYNKGYRVFGSKVNIPESSGWITKAWFSQRYKEERVVNYINSANFFVDKNTFNKIGGFNENLTSGEDSEICVRLSNSGETIFSIPPLAVTHLKNPKNITSFLRREIWHGIGAFGTFKVNKIDKPLLSTFLFIIITFFQLIGCIINYRLLVGSSILLIIFLTLVVSYNCLRYKTVKFYFQLILLFYFYFLGRMISLIIYFFWKIILNVKKPQSRS